MKILVQYFHALHCPANTLEVLHFIENHIDINHFCAFTKLFLDHEDDLHNDDGNKYDKKHLVKYTTTLPMAPDFANLSRADFHGPGGGLFYAPCGAGAGAGNAAAAVEEVAAVLWIGSARRRLPRN
ncbi:hypothetical protein VE03_10435 [Pseudogymnoascus sp. 23342-1-I1]|nr:hypothetical protein VE03_10435 [Pseudogymnoascus sp. 23342-1-I1]